MARSVQDTGEDPGAGWGGQQARKLLEKLDVVHQASRYGQVSYRVVSGVAVLFTLGAGYIIVNWNKVRTDLSHESAHVITSTIQDKQLQVGAQEFAKELIHQVLNDEQIARRVADWVMILLAKIQVEIGALVVKILHQDQVVESVNRLADKLVAYLCSNPRIAEQVGRLLVDAIFLQASRDATAAWAIDLVQRQDVTCGFRDLVVSALQMELVIAEAQSLAVGVVNRILQDPETIAEARRAVTKTLQDSELRATAKETIWGVVMPWGGNKAPNKQQAVKSIDGLMTLELSQEERQSLSSLQNRLRSGEPPGKVAEQPAMHGQAPASGTASAEAAARLAQEEAERKAREEAEAERKAREEERARLAQEEAERKAREEAERKAREEEAERKAKEEQERRAREEAELKAREEAERKAKELAERWAREEEERKVREARERAEREAFEEAERKASEEAARKAAREEAERKAKEEVDIRARQEREKAAQEARERAMREANRMVQAKAVEEAEAQEALRESLRQVGQAKEAGDKRAGEAVDRSASQAPERTSQAKAVESEGREVQWHIEAAQRAQEAQKAQDESRRKDVERTAQAAGEPTAGVHEVMEKSPGMEEREHAADIAPRSGEDVGVPSSTQPDAAPKVKEGEAEVGLQEARRVAQAPAGEGHPAKKSDEAPVRKKTKTKSRKAPVADTPPKDLKPEAAKQDKVEAQVEPQESPKPAEAAGWFTQAADGEKTEKQKPEEQKPAESSSWFGGWFRKGD